MMNREPIVVLASRSENRRQLLESLGVTFSVIPSEIDEDRITAPDIEERVRLLARAKARDVAAKASGLIVAADTFSVYDGEQYQKPGTREEAAETLRKLAGKQGRALTGICVIDTRDGRETTEINAVALRCGRLAESEIAAYVSTRPVTEWAAAYNPLDDMSASIFTPIGFYPYRIEYYGIGIETLVRELRRAGVQFDESPAISTGTHGSLSDSQ